MCIRDRVDAVVARGASLPDRIDASVWQIRLPGLEVDAVAAAVATPSVAESVQVAPVPPLATRLAQGLLAEDGQISDPLAPDRERLPAAEGDAPDAAPLAGSAVASDLSLIHIS